MTYSQLCGIISLTPGAGFAMPNQPIVECSFLIPIRHDVNLSNGELQAPELWEWLDNELLVRFGGRTAACGNFEGFYRDPDTNERVSDLSRRYIVAVDETRLGELRSLLSVACFSFQQKCIYLSVAGYVEFIEAPPDGTR